MKCLLVEAIRKRVVGVFATACSRLASPKPRRYIRLPCWAIPTVRPGASLRLNGKNILSSALTRSEPTIVRLHEVWRRTGAEESSIFAMNYQIKQIFPKCNFTDRVGTDGTRSE